MSDWVWSTAVYAMALVALGGVLGLIWPLQWLHRRSRRRALLMFGGGAVAIIAIAMITPSPRSSEGTRSGIDDFMPVFHFREQHTILVAAPPARAYAAIRLVSADEIALFNLFVTIRRFGQPGPESILNAPGQQPILDVALRTTFMLLLERAPSEIVVGTAVVAPPGTRRPDTFTGDDFKALTRPGFARATMNFVVDDLGNGTSRITTETRVFATDDVTLGRFTPYWRVIFPGSSILRATWLRAIKTRAEKASS